MHRSRPLVFASEQGDAGAPAEQGGARQAGRPVRVHPVRLLQHRLPVLLVGRGQVPRTRCAVAGLQVLASSCQPPPVTIITRDSARVPVGWLEPLPIDTFAGRQCCTLAAGADL